MTAPCLVLGAGGRVGRLLRGAWSGATGNAPVLFQSRNPGPGIDIAGPPGPGLADRIGEPVSSVLVLPGVTYGSVQDLAANTHLALSGLELARVLKAPQVVLCSSAAVYRAERDHPAFVETQAVSPDRPYGQAKLAMEQAAADWSGRFGADIQVICLRMANVIGADLLAQSIRQAVPEAPLRLDRFADGSSPRRSYLSPATLAEVVVSLAGLASPDVPRVFNLAESGPPVAMSSILEALRQCGHDVPWTWKPAPASAIRHLALNTEALRCHLPGCAALATPTSGPDLVRDWLKASGGRL